jgi:DnaJ-class molecular chaperone
VPQWVEWKGKLWLRSLLEPDGWEPLPPGACPICGGRGSTPETIDEERFDVMATCWKCKGSGKV